MTHRFGRYGKKEARRYSGFSGRPGLLPQDHGAWKNADNGFARYETQSKLTMCEENFSQVACPSPWGPYGPERPQSDSRDPAGYNTSLFRDHGDVARALNLLGYDSPDGDAMLRQFQRHWNSVVNKLSMNPTRYKHIPFAKLPTGNLRVDGIIGPDSLNAIETAIINQRTDSQLSWYNIVMMMKHDQGSGYGRRKVYNAAEGQ